MYKLSYKLPAKKGWTCIDKDIEDLIPNQGEGIITLFSLGSTSSLILIENDPNLLEDLFETLDKIAPFDHVYKHHITWHDDNGASHLRATLLGQSITLPYKEGKIVKGTWQNIVLINHDTRERERKVFITIIPHNPIAHSRL